MKSFSIKDVEKHYDDTLDYDEINDKTPSHNLRFIDGLKMSNLKSGAKILNLFCRSGKAEESEMVDGTYGFSANGSVNENVAAKNAVAQKLTSCKGIKIRAGKRA